jgi:cold shock CspA family protein
MVPCTVEVVSTPLDCLANECINFTLLFLISPIAKHVSVVRSKRDRMLAEQIKGMFDMGIPRSQGIVETTKNDFGFIRRVDSPEQIYFRADDVLEKDTVIVEGSEVEFFIIVENSKSKMSDRAVHLSLLPKGTVLFEVTTVFV